MLRFVADNVGGVGAKRKLTQKSCEPCKKRHKRCPHIDRPESSKPPASTAPQAQGSTEKAHPGAEASTHSPTPPQTGTSRSHPSAPPARLSEGSYLRFIGDLSPEASFLSNGGREDSAEKGSRHENVGVWLGQKHDNRDLEQVQGQNVSRSVGCFPQFPAKPNGLTALQSLAPYLLQECMSVLPSDYDFKFLYDLYYAKFDPIFPILRDEVLDHYSAIEKVALKQCICLVAALDPQVKGHLRLPHCQTILSQISFRVCLAGALKQCLDLEFIQNKMVVLQVCALMAFYVNSPQHSDVSTSYAAQAVQYSQTLGLHVGWPKDNDKGEKSRRIFWCVWVLDRLNAAANGRPVLIHYRDMDKRISESRSSQSPAFRLLIRIAEFLDDVISKYRPQSASLQKTPDEHPLFEDLVAEADAAAIGNPLLATLEILHSAIVILWERPKHVEGQCQQKTSSNTRFFSAMNIVSLASEDLKTSITYWPVLPYAMSMATSVAYKSLRNTSIPYKRKHAYNLFHSSCDVLEELGSAFLSARAVAKLAKETLQQVERAAADKRRPASLSDKSKDTQAQETNHHPRPDAENRARTAHPEFIGQEQDHIHESGQIPQDISFDAGQTAQDVEISDYFMCHDEIFSDLNPGFDLDRIDAVFSANLDPTMSLDLEDWPHAYHF